MAAAKMMISTTDNFLKGLQFQLEILACIAAWQTTKQTVRLCLMETRGERECSVLLWWYGTSTYQRVEMDGGGNADGMVWYDIIGWRLMERCGCGGADASVFFTREQLREIRFELYQDH